MVFIIWIRIASSVFQNFNFLWNEILQNKSPEQKLYIPWVPDFKKYYYKILLIKSIYYYISRKRKNNYIRVKWKICDRNLAHFLKNSDVLINLSLRSKYKSSIMCFQQKGLDDLLFYFINYPNSQHCGRGRVTRVGGMRFL